MSARLTPKMASFIKWYAANTKLLQHEIAARLDINQGRVSEVITGKRYQGIRPSQP